LKRVASPALPANPQPAGQEQPALAGADHSRRPRDKSICEATLAMLAVQVQLFEKKHVVIAICTERR
jgi:hypothetical protein